MSQGTEPDARNMDSVFPLPMWLLGLLLLCAEFALYGAWIFTTFIQHGDYWIAGILIVLLPLVARLLVALASYCLSRWKGVELKPEQRLGFLPWIRFFVVEYWHLCIQNLLLIPFRAFFRTRSERGIGPKQGPVVLMQHGYVNNGGVWYFTARALEALGYRVFTMDQPPFASIDTMGDLLSERVDEILSLTGAVQLTLVAHSMGGLVCRAYLRKHGTAKVQKLITLGSPHHGTWHARLARGANGTQMRIGNVWLQGFEKSLIAIPFSSIYSVHDTIIAPQTSSVMVGADNVELHAVGHVSMPSGALARAALLQALQK
jgi:triacylglycerol lipase